MGIDYEVLLIHCDDFFAVWRMIVKRGMASSVPAGRGVNQVAFGGTNEITERDNLVTVYRQK